MKIATWNVNSLNVRLNHVLQWLSDTAVDVLALQELKLDQDRFPQDALKQAGYQSVWHGQKAYNGVALVARQNIAIKDTVCGIPNYYDEQRRVIAATIGDIRCISVYCVNGESLESEKFLYKLAWFEQLLGYVKSELRHHKKLILMGDFNIAPQDIDTYDPIRWQNRIICSTQERAVFKNLLETGLIDSLRTLYPNDSTYTWWDYRAGMFDRGFGLRIDHILVSKALWPQVADCTVDPTPRAWERPSDHTPVILALHHTEPNGEGKFARLKAKRILN